MPSCTGSQWRSLCLVGALNFALILRSLALSLSLLFLLLFKLNVLVGRASLLLTYNPWIPFSSPGTGYVIYELISAALPKKKD